MSEFMRALVWSASWEMQIWGCWVTWFVVPHTPDLRRGAGSATGDGSVTCGSGIQQCELFVTSCQRSYLSDSRVNWREGVGAAPHHQAVTGREVANEDLKYLEVLLFRREERREGRTRENADPLWGFKLVFTEEESDLAVIFVKPDKKEYASTYMEIPPFFLWC